MKSFSLKFFIFILLIIFIVAFSSSYSSLSIDNLAYVLAIGIDSSENNKMEVTFQFSQPSSSSDDNGDTEKTSSVINSVTTSSISNAINLINGYLGKQVNMSHCKVVIFSEEFASKGISDEIYTLINDPQVRPTTNIIISKCTAKDYIKNTKPQLEDLLSRYYEIFARSSKYTGYMPHSTLGDFYNSLISKTSEPYAILGGINISKPSSDKNINSQKDYKVKSNYSSIEGDNGIENIGVAVFKNDRLIGELDALESISLLTLKNKLNQFMISVPDNKNNNTYIDVYITSLSSPKIRVYTNNINPYINISCEFSGRIYSMSENSKYLTSETLDTLSNSCNSYIKNMITEFLYKTSKEFKSDITGIGKYSLRNFLTVEDFKEYNWNKNYKNSFFNVNINTSIKSSMLVTET